MANPLVAAAGDGPLDQDPELDAAWTVSAVLAARPERRDVAGAPPLTHDFDLHADDGLTIALEVTRLSVREVVKMWDAIGSIDWACPELSFNWSVSVQSAGRGRFGTQIKRFRAEAPTLMARLEALDDGCFGDIVGGNLPRRSKEAQRAIEGLRGLGARSGGPVGRPMSGPALIAVGAVGPGGAVDGSDVNRAVEDAALANLLKLRSAPGDERHIFAWVDATDPGANVAMWTFTRPEPPRVPAGIDCVWVGLWQPGVNPQSNAFTLWRVTPPGPWEIHDLPAVRDYAERVTRGWNR